jgi:hypothetical protein
MCQGIKPKLGPSVYSLGLLVCKYVQDRRIRISSSKTTRTFPDEIRNVIDAHVL